MLILNFDFRVSIKMAACLSSAPPTRTCIVPQIPHLGAALAMTSLLMTLRWSVLTAIHVNATANSFSLREWTFPFRWRHNPNPDLRWIHPATVCVIELSPLADVVWHLSTLSVMNSRFEVLPRDLPYWNTNEGKMRKMLKRFILNTPHVQRGWVCDWNFVWGSDILADSRLFWARFLDTRRLKFSQWLSGWVSAHLSLRRVRQLPGGPNF